MYLCFGVLFYHHLHSQCTDASQVVSYSSTGLHTMSSSLNEGDGFSVVGSISVGGETDYVLYLFQDESSPTNAIRISSGLNDTGGPVIHTKLANGNYVLAGYSQIGSQRHLKIVCFDEANVLWQKRLEGNLESPRAIYATGNGGLLLVGTSHAESNGSSDAFAIEFDQNGNVNWKKGFGGADNEHFYGALNSFDDLHLVVGNNKTYSGTHRPALATIDNLGDLVEYNVYTGAALALWSTITKYEGTYYAGGYVEQGGRQGIIVAMDEDYEVIWSKRVDIDGYSSNYVSGVGVDDNGFLYVSALGSGANSRLHYMRVDPESGDLISAVTSTIDIASNEVLTIGGYQIEATESGSLSVSNDISSGDFILVRTNECLDNSACLEDAEITLLNYNLTRTDFSPGERILQDVDDISEFELTGIDLPIPQTCDIVCSGTLVVPDISGCINEPIEMTFNLEDETSEIESYFWEIDDGTSSNAGDLTLTYPNEIVQDYSLTVTTENGCEYSASGVFTVTAPPDFPDIETQVNLCEGEVFTLDATAYPEWVVTDPDGNDVTVFTTDDPGNYGFTFSSACLIEQVDIFIDQIVISDFIDFEDQIICTGDDVVVDIPNWESLSAESDIQVALEADAPESYLGNPLDFTFSEEGVFTFVINGTILNCPFNQSFEIDVLSPPESFAQNNFSICAGDEVNLDFSDLTFQVIDSEGQVVSSALLSTGGTYVFTGQNACSSFEEIVTVNETAINPTSFGDLQFICEGQDTIAIGFNSIDYAYLWGTGSQDSSILVVEAGQYEVMVSDTTGVCAESFIFQVNDFPYSPSTIFDFPAVDICLEGQTNINFPPQFGPYTFSDTLIGYTYTATETESLSYTYSDGCYTYPDTLFISVESCLCPAWVPNVFTPDEDGLNDFFKPVFDCEVYDYQMTIFNRWGREFFQSNDIEIPWQGQSPNPDFYAGTGVYVYLIVFHQKMGGLRVPQEITGSVTLLR